MKPVWKKIVAGVLIFFAVMALGVLLPFVLPDGSGRYSGAEKEVAKLGVDRINSTTDPMSDPFFMRAYVKSVYAGPPKIGQCFPETPYSNDPTKPEHYGAEVGYRSFFGVEYKNVDYHTCQDIGR